MEVVHHDGKALLESECHIAEEWKILASQWCGGGVGCQQSGSWWAWSKSSSWCQSRVIGWPLHIDISTGLTYLILKDPCSGRHYLFNSNNLSRVALVRVVGCLFFMRR